MTFTLGASPENLSVILTQGADFNTTLHNSDGNWSPTATIELRFGVDPENPITTWSAVITDDDAVFAVDKAVVDVLLAETDKSVRLWYIDGTTDLCWAKGSRTKR